MKWTTLRHNGVAFPPPYDYRGLTVRIKGEPVKLEPLQEEMLMAWAKKKDTVYVQDPEFQKNFLQDLREALPKRFADISLSDIDWTELHGIAEREKTANLSPEEKKKRSQERKTVREELKAKHGTAIIDGTETEIGAYLVEPPGILMGRGDYHVDASGKLTVRNAHPLRGRWKPRIEPEEVVLNLDEEAPVPELPDGQQWKEIVHKHDAMWVASWYDKLAKKWKYVWLADSSHLRQERDKEKYVKASKLESSVERVREQIRKSMAGSDRRALSSLDKRSRKLREEIARYDVRVAQASEVGDQEGRKKTEDQLGALRKEQGILERQRDKLVGTDIRTRKIATVCYLIDRLAMRVGDEKDEDEADTVGACTLRVEHIKIDDEKIEFDFYGKDSVHWSKSLALDDKEQVLARNLREFTEGKQPGDQIFDKIDSTHVNRFLSSIVPGLSAKVFRTYHATTTVRNCLRENGNTSTEAPLFEKEYTAKLANLQAAITCNHKRTPPKNWEENLAKKEQALEQLRAHKPDLTKLAREIDKRQAALDKLLQEQKKLASAPRAIQAKQKALTELEATPTPADEKESAKLDKQRKAARKAVEQAQQDFEKKSKRIVERIDKARQALEHAQSAPQRAEQEYKERVEKAELQLKLAKATRDYNLGTSLKNYIDPRVYKAWGDYVGYDWKRLYTKALQRKFAWVNQSRLRWNAPSGEYAAEDDDAEDSVVQDSDQEENIVLNQAA